MFAFGQKEIDAFAKVARSGRLFRYTRNSQCERFERRYAKFLGVNHATMTASGTAALTAALAALEIGPGDEVIVPAHTYMATAIAVLAVGAIPVIVDIDESIMMSPEALDDAVGPRTRAVIPVHMWGLVCDMDAIMRVARKHKLRVVEDACQCIGGAYRGRRVGSIGHAGAFSFNFYKNMSCGEGGAVVTRNARLARRARCAVDCCAFYWTGRRAADKPFAANGARASEFEGAVLNVQLDRLPATLRKLRRMKKRILRATAGHCGLTPAPRHSPDQECATTVLYTFPTEPSARRFVECAFGQQLIHTGRHTYCEWDPVLNHAGGHHPAMNPFNMPQNRRCRMKYSKDMLPRSLDILRRTVMVGIPFDRTAAGWDRNIARIRAAAEVALGNPKVPLRADPHRTRHI